MLSPLDSVTLARTFSLMRAPKLVSLDPPEHTRLRGNLTRALSAQRIASLEPSILMAGARALKPLVVSQGLATAQEYDQNLSILQQEWERHHSMLSLYVAYGQRSVSTVS
jgi:hypothetical protein